MLDIGMPELMLIMVIALIVLGPEKLPDFALRIGRMVYQFRQQYQEIAGQIRAELERAQQEVQSITGDLGLGFDSGSGVNDPRLRVSILGAVAGIEPSAPVAPALQCSTLAAVCGRALSTPLPMIPTVEATAVAPEILVPLHVNGSTGDGEVEVPSSALRASEPRVPAP
jgi:Tat protein translocase TatB subunit